jgi:hypothetical protein
LNEAAALNSFADRRRLFQIRNPKMPETMTISAMIPPITPAIEPPGSLPLSVLATDDCVEVEPLGLVVPYEPEEDLNVLKLLEVLTPKSIVVKAVGVTVGTVDPINDDGRALNSRCWASPGVTPLFGLAKALMQMLI